MHGLSLDIWFLCENLFLENNYPAIISNKIYRSMQSQKSAITSLMIQNQKAASAIDFVQQ